MQLKAALKSGRRKWGRILIFLWFLCTFQCIHISRASLSQRSWSGPCSYIEGDGPSMQNFFTKICSQIAAVNRKNCRMSAQFTQGSGPSYWAPSHCSSLQHISHSSAIAHRRVIIFNHSVMLDFGRGSYISIECGGLSQLSKKLMMCLDHFSTFIVCCEMEKVDHHYCRGRSLVVNKLGVFRMCCN